MDRNMTGDSGAGRTFRSIFGDPHQKLREFREEAEDEMWLDDPPQDILGDSKLAEDNNEVNQEGIRKSCSKHEGTRGWNRASMEEWVEEDDDETWNEALDALQVKVNQLELNKPNDEKILLSNPTERTSSSTVEQKMDIESKICAQVEGIENKITDRWHGRNPSGVIPCSTVDENAISQSQQNTTTTVKLKKTTKSKDYISRNIRAIEKNRPVKVASSMAAPAKREETLKKSTSKLAGVYVNQSRNRGLSDGANGNILKTSMLAISDPELIRRYVLNEVRKISIERLVADSKRLHYLEAYHETHKIVDSGIVYLKPKCSTE